MRLKLILPIEFDGLLVKPEAFVFLLFFYETALGLKAKGGPFCIPFGCHCEGQRVDKKISNLHVLKP